MVRALVIGYGSTLRGDDAAGRVLAEMVERDSRAGGATVLSRTQLTPELAVDLAAADVVVFVDASESQPAGQVAVRRVLPGDGEALTHQVTPEALLALAESLYGHAPTASLVSVGVETTALGTELSEKLSESLPRALEAVVSALAAEA